MPIKDFLFIAIATGILLLLPLLAHFPWTGSDFVVMGILLFVGGTLLDLVIRKSGKYRIVVAIGVVVLFLWLWVELAVGLFTNWGS